LIKCGVLSTNFCCSNCKKAPDDLKLLRDTLDVWFISGLSNVIINNAASNLVVEGRDQHRGWFSASMVTEFIIKDKPSSTTLLTHGFCSINGEKISKSKYGVLPNMSLQEILQQNNLDRFRFWVANTSFCNDIPISKEALHYSKKENIKIRKTFRGLIANIGSDFIMERDGFEFHKLLMIDKFALASLFNMNSKIHAAYKNFDFPTVIKIFTHYCKELRSLYLENVKNRTYYEPPNSFKRRSAQTTMNHILDVITRLIAPIMSFLAEEVAVYYRSSKESIHLQSFLQPVNIWNEVYTHKFGETTTKAMNAYFNTKFKQQSALEKIRIASQKENGKLMLGHSLRTSCVIILHPESETGKSLALLRDELEENLFEQFLEEYFNVSHSELVLEIDKNGGKLPDAGLKITLAAGTECPRCWKISVSSHSEDLCPRCAYVISLQ